jgi:hypothetical protein
MRPFDTPLSLVSRVRLKRDSARAETRFRLSPKRTSPCKSTGASVQSMIHDLYSDPWFSRLLAAEERISALVMLDTPRSEVVWEYWLPTPFASFPFTSPPVRRCVPSGFRRTLQTSLKQKTTKKIGLHNTESHQGVLYEKLYLNMLMVALCNCSTY